MRPEAPVAPAPRRGPALPPERELTQAVDLCAPDGGLDPAAIGWSRSPLHRCNLKGAWGRKKRWDFWCVTSPACALSLTYANLDYLGLAAVSFVDFEERRILEHGMVVPFGLSFRSPETVRGGDLSFRIPGLRLAIREAGNLTHLEVGFRRPFAPPLSARIRVERPPTVESLSVVVPWSARRFAFTSKQPALPAAGEILRGDRAYPLGKANRAFATLDFGRGLWPYRTSWNWASASGVEGGRTLGLQFGGKWTDGTGTTENGILLDGRLHKIAETVRFDYDRGDFRRPWRIRTEPSGIVDLTFEPFFDRALRVPLGLLGAETHQCFGHFRGSVRTGAGETVRVEHLLGWAEEMLARW